MNECQQVVGRVGVLYHFCVIKATGYTATATNIIGALPHAADQQCHNVGSLPKSVKFVVCVPVLISCNSQSVMRVPLYVVNF